MNVEITQTALAAELEMKKSALSLILSGKKRVRRDQARLLQKISGIDHLVWRDGSVKNIVSALEDVYGKINFKRGRPLGR